MAKIRKFDLLTQKIRRRAVLPMHKLVSFYLFLIVLIICSSCSNKQYQTLFQERRALSDSTAQKTPAATVPLYHIKAQDIIQVKNLQDPNFLSKNVSAIPSGGAPAASGVSEDTFLVDDDGSVNLPIVGRVQVAGLTRFDAQNLLEQLYHKDRFKDPIIELKIVNLKVTVLGEIRSQGNFPLTKDKTTLVEIIGQAGGLSDRANEKKIQIIRGGELNPTVIEVNLDDISSINDPRTLLQNGDIIYVAQSKRAARNDNLQNFSIITQPALLILNTVLVVLALARK